MKILIILAVYPIFFAFSQSELESHLLKTYQSLAEINDSESLGYQNDLVLNLHRDKKIKLEGHLKDKFLQTQQYLQIKNKLEECLEGTDQEMKMGLDKAILAMFKKDIFQSDSEKTFQNCKRLGNLAKNLQNFKAFLDTYKPDEQYKYYSHVQEQLYDEAMGNAMRTYADLSRYDFKGEPKSWQEYLEKELTKNFCKPVKNKIDQLESLKDNTNRIPVFGSTNPNCQKLAKKVTEEFAKRERIPLDRAVKMLNQSVDQLDEKMHKVRASMKDRDYLAYKSTYQSILSKSPGTLLLTDVLQDREQGIGSLVEEKDIYSNLRPVFHNRIDTKDNKHFDILGKALKEAKEKTKEGIEKIHQDFHQKDYDDAEAKNYFNIRGKILKSRRKSDIEDLVTYYPSAAAQMLSADPYHVYAICEAIIGAEKSRETDETIDNAVMWGGLIVGGALIATGAGSGVGALLITGALGGGYSSYVAVKNYNEFKHHEAALYANNSNDIQALDESYGEFKKALIFAGAEFLFMPADPNFIKVISRLNPKQLKDVSVAIKKLPAGSSKNDVQKIIAKKGDPAELAKKKTIPPPDKIMLLPDDITPAEIEALENLAYLKAAGPIDEVAPNLKGASKRKYKTTEMDPDYKGEELGKVYDTKVEYFSKDVNDRLKIYVNEKGKLVNFQGNSLNVRIGIFVMDQYGNIFHFPKDSISGIVHHSSFLGGKPAASAGMLSVEDGVLKVINDNSGHYTPNSDIFEQVIKELKERGANLKEMKIDRFSHF